MRPAYMGTYGKDHGECSFDPKSRANAVGKGVVIDEEDKEEYHCEGETSE